MLGCIPSPKFRVIHRSLLFEAIQEQKRELLTETLEALKATEETNTKQDAEPPKDAVEENDKEPEDDNGEPTNKEEEDIDSENVSKIVEALEKLDQAHREQKGNLIKANENIKSSRVDKVVNMQEKIQSAKENLGRKEKMELHLLDQPNAEGKTLMQITTEMDDDEATIILLRHGANPNVVDSEGNSPLHTLCDQKDVKTATDILKSNGKLLVNKESKMPAIEELFFVPDYEDVQELVEAIDQSRHRKEILDKILRREHLLFRLVENEKSEVLSIVLKKLKHLNLDQEDYVNLVRNRGDGNTPLHLALSQKSLKCASVLLEAGARLTTNARGLTPPIEEFFTEENDNQITTALVDGLVERVKANQLNEKQALKLLIPDDKNRKILFHLAQGSNWGLISEWAKEDKINFSNIVPHLTSSELEKVVEVVKEGHWKKEEVNTLFCMEDHDGTIILSRLQLDTQLKVATWNQARTNQIAHKMSKDFVQGLILEATEGNWNGEELGNSFCQLDSDKKLKLATVDVELQKQLAVLSKTKTCLSVPLLENSIQQWLYQEAAEGRWDQAMVFKVLEKKETVNGAAVTAVAKPGM